MWFIRPVCDLAKRMFIIMNDVIDLIEWFCHSTCTFLRFLCSESRARREAPAISGTTIAYLDAFILFDHSACSLFNKLPGYYYAGSSNITHSG